MRITALALSYPPHRRIGAELALHALVTHLRDQGHTIEVLTTQPLPRTTVDGIHVRPARIPRPTCDLVITNAGLAAQARQWWPTTPLAVWSHNSQLSTLLDVRTANRRGRVHLITNTRHMRAVYQDVLGIDSTILHPPTPRADPTPGGTGILLVNPTPDKGSATFWGLALTNPDLEFLTVRGGYGTPDLMDLPNTQVLPHGPLDDVWPQTRLLLLPSRHESYAMTAVEAAHRGIPTLASDLPGVREALGDGALYITPGGDWNEGLHHMLTHLHEYAARALTHARTSVDTPTELATVTAALHAFCHTK